MQPNQILAFYQLAEKLKVTLRHSWLSDPQRQESTAEHSWMMGLLAMVLLPQVPEPLDQLKVFQMIIVHDLAEALTADLPVWEGVKDKAAKEAHERAAMTQLLAPLDAPTRATLLAVWEEYELRQSREAKFVKVLDTTDVIMQHNIADISSWDDNDARWQLSPLQDAFFDFDPTMRQLKVAIDAWSISKAAAAGQLNRLDQAELAKRPPKP